MAHRLASVAIPALVGTLAFTAVSANAGIPAGIVNSQAGQALTGAPVQVESCVIQPSQSPVVMSLSSTAIGVFAGRVNSPAAYVGAALGSAAVSRASGAGRLVVKYANESGIQADLVRLRVGNVFVRDEVAIRSGDVVQRSYSENGAFQAYGSSAQSVSCELDFVHFADGTSWSAAKR